MRTYMSVACRWLECSGDCSICGRCDDGSGVIPAEGAELACNY